MNKEEFYRRFANMPLSQRLVNLDFVNYGLKTISDVYKDIHDLDDTMRPMRIQMDELLKIAEKFIPLLENHEK